jgi:putative tryptophan/tyrosine transport system substrate-binding protein
MLLSRHTRRRDVIAGLLVAATMGRAQAQQGLKSFRIAIADPSTPVSEMNEAGSFPGYRALFKELRRLGYVEGQNLAVERHSGDGRTEQLRELARAVVRSSPDLIFASSSDMVRNLKTETTTIPIVAGTGDPIANGIVTSLARPGGNITGASGDAGLDILGKRLELLIEAVPNVSKVGFLASREAWEKPYGPVLQQAAQRVGLIIVGPPIDAPLTEPEYRRVVEAMTQARIDALIVSDQPLHLANRRLIVGLAAKARLPAIYAWHEFIEVGGFMAYAFDLPDMMRHLAAEIDQVLRGAKPGDIPYYQATKFELVINLKTAKALGLTIPAVLLARADEVIE